MTTLVAAVMYEAQHVYNYSNSKDVVYNPHEKPIQELPSIYGFNNGGTYGYMIAQLISQDGVNLGSHICSSEPYMAADLGVIEPNSSRHDKFKEHYPDGYKMEFVGYHLVATHTGLQQAFKNYEIKNPKSGEVK